MKDIQNYEGLYGITEDGKVWSYRSKKFLSPGTESGGYLKVGLCKDGIRKQFKVHRLVAQAYIPNPDNLPQVNHLDEVKTNNCVSNLSWSTASDNCKYGTHMDRVKANGNGGRPRKVYCVELDKEFPSITAAAREIGVHKQCIGDCLRGLQKTSGGYHWQYVETSAESPN